MIANRLLDPGAYASPSQPVLQVARVDKVWINVNVPDEDLAYVRPGVTVRYQSTSLPGRTFAGPIQTVNARADRRHACRISRGSKSRIPVTCSAAACSSRSP